MVDFMSYPEISYLYDEFTMVGRLLTLFLSLLSPGLVALKRGNDFSFYYMYIYIYMYVMLDY